MEDKVNTLPELKRMINDALAELKQYQIQAAVCLVVVVLRYIPEVVLVAAVAVEYEMP